MGIGERGHPGENGLRGHGCNPMWVIKSCLNSDCDVTNLQSIKGFKFSKEEERAEEEILMSQQWKWFSNFCLYYVAGMSHMALPRFWEVEFSGPEGK